MNIEIYGEEKIAIFYNIIILIKRSTLTVSFDVTADRLFIQGMDSSKITLHEVTLSPSWFDVFTLETSELISSCSTILLDKIFSSYKSGQTFKLYTNDENKINIEFIGESGGAFNKYFQIGTMEIEQDYKEIPKDIEYDCTFTIDSRILIDTMNQLLKFGEVLEIKYGVNGVYFVATDDLDNKFSVEIKSSQLSYFEYLVDENEQEEYTVSLLFSLKTLFTSCLSVKITSLIRISLLDNSPMKIEHLTSQDQHSEFECLFFIAPKV